MTFVALPRLYADLLTTRGFSRGGLSAMLAAQPVSFRFTSVEWALPRASRRSSGHFLTPSRRRLVRRDSATSAAM
jgi:hypothetical protein